MTNEVVVNEEVLVKEEKKNYFAELAAVNVSEHIEKKNGFSYLSWPFAIDQLKRRHPDAEINVKRFPEKDENGEVRMVPYMRTNTGYFVEVEVIIDGVSVSEPFAVTDYKNKAMPNPSATDINNSIQRAKVKAIASHGLGLYIYAGEDLPIDAVEEGKQPNTKPQSVNQPKANNPQGNQQPKQTGPRMASGQHVATIQGLANQMASLELGQAETPELKRQKLVDICANYKIVKNMEEKTALAITAQMQKDLKAAHDARMQQQAAAAAQQQAQQQQTQPAGNMFFNMPSDNLEDVL